MGAVWLVLLYLATALVLAALSRLAGRRRPSLAASAVLTLLPLAFTASGFLPGRALAPTAGLAGVAPWVDPELVARVEAGSSGRNPLLFDPMSQMIPWRRAAEDGLAFNPAQGSGAALLANGQSAVLFPTEAAARALTPFRAVTYSQAARLLLAAWGLFLLARFLALGEAAALLAATAWLGCGFLQLWRLHPHTLVAAALPWIVLAALALARRPGPRPAVLLAVAGAVGFAGGHPETLLHGALFAVLLALAVVLGRRDRRRRLARAAGWAAAAAALAAALAAPLLLPFVAALGESTEWNDARFERRRQLAGGWSDVLDRLAPAAAQLALGDPRTGTWRGPENLAELGGGALGAAPLVLAALALAPGGGRRARVRRRLAAVLLVAGLVGLAVAAHLPGISAPFGALPLLRDSLLKRLSLWWALAAALAAGLGVEAARRGRGLRPALVAAAAVAALVALAAAWAPAAERGRIVALEGLALAAALAGIALAAGAARTGRRAAVAVAVLGAAILAPRAVLFARWVPVVSADGFYGETLATRFVAERLAAAGPLGARVTGLDAALAPHSAAFLGFEEVRAYDPMGFAPYHRFLSALGAVPRTGWVRIVDPALPALAMLGVRYVFDHPSMSHRPGVEVAYLGRDAIVYEVPGALPRLWVPARLEAVAEPRAAVAAAREVADYAALAVVDRGLAGPGTAARANGEATLTELAVGRGRIDAVVEARSEAVVASSQPAIRGWRIDLDGAALEPDRRRTVNGAFLGVAVPPGRHTLAFRYRPPGWPWAWLLAVLGAAGAAALGFAGRRRPAP